MTPYLKDGQVLLARKIFNRKTKGRIVVAWHNGKEIVKFASRREAGRTLLLGRDRYHDAGWVANDAIRAKVIWPRIADKDWNRQ